MIGVVLKHIDELDRHIAELDDEIDRNMSDGDKARVAQLDNIPGIAEDSAKTILAIIGTDISRFSSANHLMLFAIYHRLKNGEMFSERGADYYNQFNRERKANALLRKLHLLGWQQPVAFA